MSDLLRIFGPLPMEWLTDTLADSGWTLSEEGEIALCAVADREEAFVSVRPLVRQGLSVVAMGPVGDVPCAVSALRAGALEYLETNASKEALIAALERVAARKRRGAAPDAPSSKEAGWLEAYLGGDSAGLRTTGTGAFSLAYLREQYRRETWRCRRSGQPFSLAVVTGEPNEDPVAFATTVEDVAREVDVVAEIGPREWVVLLPETDRLGAILFRRRLWRALSRGSPGSALPTRLPSSIGVASHPGDGEGLESLIEKAREDGVAFGRSAAGRYRELDFWATVEALVSRGFLSDGREGTAVFREVWREAARDPSRRCLLYLGGESLPLTGPPLGGGSRLHLLGSRAVDLPGGVIGVSADPRMARHQIALYLGERDAYAYLRQVDPAGRSPSFQTSDTALVDHLIGTLHDSYELPT